MNEQPTRSVALPTRLAIVLVLLLWAPSGFAQTNSSKFTSKAFILLKAYRPHETYIVIGNLSYRTKGICKYAALADYYPARVEGRKLKLLAKGKVCTYRIREITHNDGENGYFSASKDGRTYLEILGGSECSILMVDGKVWPYSRGVTGHVEPGHHNTSCDGGRHYEFDIPNGVVYTFDFRD